MILFLPSESERSSEMPSKGKGVRKLSIQPSSYRGNSAAGKIDSEVFLETLVKPCAGRCLHSGILSQTGVGDCVDVQGSVQSQGWNWVGGEALWEGEVRP